MRRWKQQWRGFRGDCVVGDFSFEDTEEIILITVRVSYKYGPKGQKASGLRPVESIQAEAKTESAVLAALRRMHPTFGEIVILKIE